MMNDEVFVFLRRFDCDSEIIFTFADRNEKNKPFVISKRHFNVE